MNDIEFIEGYLERIDLPLVPSVDADSLLLLQTGHLRHVPFENLDIMTGDVPLSLDPDDLWDKLVRRRRGGICYEHNVLFASVLERLGFHVRRMAAHDPIFGANEYDHMFLMVDFPELEDTWVVDVGFGSNNLAPIKFILNTWQSDLRDSLHIAPLGAGVFDLVRRTATGEEAMYEFNLRVHTDAQYQPRCDWFATAPGSPYNREPIVSIDAMGGRMTLTAEHLSHYVDGQERKEPVRDLEHWDRLLVDEFGIELDDAALAKVHARLPR